MDLTWPDFEPAMHLSAELEVRCREPESPRAMLLFHNFSAYNRSELLQCDKLQPRVHTIPEGVHVEPTFFSL